jgi:hypothetical protein
MATATIPMLPQAQSLLGTEQMEAVQSGSSVRVTTAQIVSLAQFLVPIGPTGVAEDTPSGTVNNYTVNGQMSASIGFIELTPTSITEITGLQAGFDGQIVTITNLSPTNVISLQVLNSGSLAANQFRYTNNINLVQYTSQSWQYSASIGLWVFYG